VSMSFDGPDGGTCAISGTTANCHSQGDACKCDISSEVHTGDCKADGSTTSVWDPPETQGNGL
jgi:hypothetical protein